MNILLATLGASWAVVPELYGWLSHEELNLYSEHNQLDELLQLRNQNNLEAPDELWICTTAGEKAKRSLIGLQDWWRYIGSPRPLRIWQATECDRLSTADECKEMREMLCRVVLLAHEKTQPDGQLLLSLAGGRKTMSADLQWAGSVLGAHHLLHVIGPEPLPAALLDADAELFSKPLHPDWVSEIRPIIVGSGGRSELLDLEIDGVRLESSRFPISIADPLCSWTGNEYEPQLADAISMREEESAQLLGNYLKVLGSQEVYQNWRSLYRLPPQTINKLRHTNLTKTHLKWLCNLPKADLHRHLGGCLGIAAQKKVAAEIVNSMTQEQHLHAKRDIAPIVATWPNDWPDRLRAFTPLARAERCAVILNSLTTSELESILFPEEYPRVALKSTHPEGFKAYELPGELTGSAVLAHPAALLPYAEAIVAQCRKEGLSYLELRGSPHKYDSLDPSGFLRRFKEALELAGATIAHEPVKNFENASPVIGFVWILDRRHSTEQIRQQIEIATVPDANTEGFLLGFDLAGDEGTKAPNMLAKGFLPVFQRCMNITIHAGEGEPADNIWRAAYELHADRVGHGLSLAGSKPLLKRFRDKGICIELCPSSNIEVVGFFDPQRPGTESYPKYPLREFMNEGIAVTLCTDNPSFSNTTLAEEFVIAARLVDGISLWEVLALIRKGFQKAFIDAETLDALMKHVDNQLYTMLANFQE